MKTQIGHSYHFPLSVFGLCSIVFALLRMKLYLYNSILFHIKNFETMKLSINELRNQLTSRELLAPIQLFAIKGGDGEDLRRSASFMTSTATILGTTTTTTTTATITIKWK